MFKRFLALFLFVIIGILTISGCSMKEEKNGLLFDDVDGTYNYAPSVLQVSDSERYIYYCGSPGDRRIVDLIQVRKGVKNKKSGQWEYGDLKTALQPTMLSWDSSHTCDPSVVAGEFKYQNETYNYLLTYLGCATANNQENEMGMAVSKDPMGPFIKCDEINPIIDFVRDKDKDNEFQWGYGQASMINVDKKGKVLMFYTEGNPIETLTHVSRWDFSNLDNPVCEFTKRMSVNGLTNPYGGTDFMNSADFMYDPSNRRIYAVSPEHTPISNINLTGISEITRVNYIDELSGELAGDGFAVDSIGEWKKLYSISKKTTGFDYQHNCGFVRDMYGWIVDPDVVEIVYTCGIVNEEEQDPLSVIWTYRLYNYRYKI